MNRVTTGNGDARSVRVASFMAQVRGASAAEREAVAAAIERETVAELQRQEITARIKQARVETGLSQPEMAEALHTHERTYQNYESQKQPRVPWGLMNEIATITGRSTEWLIHGEQPANGAAPDRLAAIENQLADINRKLDDLRRALALVETEPEELPMPNQAAPSSGSAAAGTSGRARTRKLRGA